MYNLSFSVFCGSLFIKTRDAKFIKSRHMTKYKNQDEITLNSFSSQYGCYKIMCLQKKYTKNYHWKFPEHRWERKDFSSAIANILQLCGPFHGVLFWTASGSSCAPKKASPQTSRSPSRASVASRLRCKSSLQSFIKRALSGLFAF